MVGRDEDAPPGAVPDAIPRVDRTDTRLRFGAGPPRPHQAKLAASVKRWDTPSRVLAMTASELTAPTRAKRKKGERQGGKTRWEGARGPWPIALSAGRDAIS